jgi:hypothetical protein
MGNKSGKRDASGNGAKANPTCLEDFGYHWVKGTSFEEPSLFVALNTHHSAKFATN